MPDTPHMSEESRKAIQEEDIHEVQQEEHHPERNAPPPDKRRKASAVAVGLFVLAVGAGLIVTYQLTGLGGLGSVVALLGAVLGLWVIYVGLVVSRRHSDREHAREVARRRHPEHFREAQGQA